MSSTSADRKAPIYPPVLPKAVTQWLIHLQIRRFIYFCLVYRPALPSTDPLVGAGYETSLKALDEALTSAKGLGLLTARWEFKPPNANIACDLGGFVLGFLQTNLQPQDLRALGL